MGHLFILVMPFFDVHLSYLIEKVKLLSYNTGLLGTRSLGFPPDSK
jgi:hypothetical protein